MYLRFLQLKRSGNVKLRNKMKKGKAGWFVVSMCFLGAGLGFVVNPASVQADETSDNSVQTESANLTPQESVDNEVKQQPVNNAFKGDNSSQVMVKPESNVNGQPISQANSQNNQIDTSNIDKGSNLEAETTDQVGNSTVTRKMMAEGSDANLDKTSGMGDTTNIAESKPGADGTWYLSSDGVLHMVGGTFATVVPDVNHPDDHVELPFGFDYNVVPKVKTIDIDNTVKVGEEANSLFSGFSNLTGINGMENLDTSSTTDMSNMFLWDYNLDTRKVDFSKLNTSNVTDMHNMFNGAFMYNNDEDNNPEPVLDLSSFDTSKVTNMSEMFQSAQALASINMNNWDTSNVTDMGYMFDDTQNLISLDVSKFNTEKVKFMENMFTSPKLLHLDLSNFKTPSLTAVSAMFGGCTKLESIDLSSIDMSKVERIYSAGAMFVGDINLKKIIVNDTTILDGTWLSEIMPNGIYTGKWYGGVNDNGDKIAISSSDLMKLYPNDGVPSTPAMLSAHKTYSWEIDTDVIINTNLGDKVVHIDGPFDTPNYYIPVPVVEGYTSDLTKVKADVDSTGITPTQSVTYTPTPKKPSGSSSHHSGSDKNTNSVEQLNQTVMTYHNQDNVKLYTMDGQEITNRELYPGTDWFSDEVVTRDNVKYYRVATNELVKAEDALVYVDHAATIVTKNGSPKSLSNEHSQNVSDRMLMSDTAWKTDRYAFFNGTKFYRVATNEWVNADDVQDNL